MKRSLTIFLFIFLIRGLSSSALAQHTDFILFGQPNPDVANISTDEKFVHPLTAPYFHEDSFVTTDFRAWYLYHDFPKSSAIDGGHATVIAVQARFALTERIQFVANKDGYVDFDTGLVNEEGWNDIAVGLKWNFLQDWENQLHAGVGIGYEFRTGQSRVLQNDDEWRIWGSINKGFNKLHLGLTLNYFVAGDKSNGALGLGNSDRLSWHLHVDYWLNKWFSPVVEFNGYHVVDEGAGIAPFHGLDVANLGGGEDEDAISIGIGAEVRPVTKFAVRVAYEMPLTKEEDLLGYRWTFSTVWSF